MNVQSVVLDFAKSPSCLFHLFVVCFCCHRRQFRVVSDVFIKLEGIAEVINEMLPKFASKW